MVDLSFSLPPDTSSRALAYKCDFKSSRRYRALKQNNNSTNKKEIRPSSREVYDEAFKAAYDLDVRSQEAGIQTGRVRRLLDKIYSAIRHLKDIRAIIRTIQELVEFLRDSIEG